MSTEGLLHRMQRVAVGQAVDGADLFALHLDGERRARVDRAAVDDHRAGAAGAAVADALVAGQIGAVAQRVEQRDARLDRQVEPLAVRPSSVTGTSPGQITAGPVCASTSATPTEVTAVARLLTPAVFRKAAAADAGRDRVFSNTRLSEP